MFVCKKVSLNLRVWIVADVHEILVLGNPKFSDVNILLLDILKYLISLACYFKSIRGIQNLLSVVPVLSLSFLCSQRP